ncbi:hypothetical protein [Kitasatospora camelliae]|uniref:Uncharacterized protein n=1 Tax=Kitasatospora camelliae TaxID=3156397 RepID=A0AAU8K8F9_9ACTN
MDFPGRSTLAGLSEPEYEALAAFDDVIGDLEHEWEAARATSRRLVRMMDAAERRLDNGTVALSLHFDALDQTASAALDLVSGLERLLCRYTTAYVATGLSILDRLVAGRPPLTPAELEVLRAEPSVGRLQELLEVPAEHRYAARAAASGPGELERYRDQRTQLLRSIESLYSNLTADGQAWTRVTVAAGRLSDMDDGTYDEPWADLVPPLLNLARQNPYEISVALDPGPAPDGPRRRR